MLQSEAINADTRALLAELKENAQNTNKLLSQQFDKVLERLLVVTEKTVEETVDSPNKEQLRINLDRNLRRVIGNASSFEFGTNWRRPAHPDDFKLEEYMSTFPDEEEGRDSAETLKRLTPDGVGSLRKFATDLLMTIHGKGDPGLYEELAGNGTEELIREDLIKEAVPSSGIRFSQLRFFVLTEKGRAAGRLLTARGPVPDYLRTLVDRQI